jgi:hypothetical protein
MAWRKMIDDNVKMILEEDEVSSWEGGEWAGHGARDAYLSESTDNEMNSAQTPGHRREICQVLQKSIVA